MAAISTRCIVQKGKIDRYNVQKLHSLAKSFRCWGQILTTLSSPLIDFLKVY